LCKKLSSNIYNNKFKIGLSYQILQEKLSQFEKQLVEERKLRMAERKEQRKLDRREKWRKEKEEAEQRARDEALKWGM